MLTSTINFNPETGTPFWLDFARKLTWDPRKEIRTYEDLDKFGFFEDELAAIITNWLLNVSPDWMQDIFTIGQDLTQVVKSTRIFWRPISFDLGIRCSS